MYNYITTHSAKNIKKLTIFLQMTILIIIPIIYNSGVYITFSLHVLRMVI